MSNVPGDLKYTKTHEWVRLDDDGTAVVGITDHAQAALGDLVFVETPETGQQLVVGDACAVVESVKAASDIYTPVSGTITEVNEVLLDSPELLNADPYGDGWIFRIRLAEASQLDGLMSSEAYQEAAVED